jgi:EAL domain-containing protein (putative c-di-GMP-specific phosphodiesterase class I)
MDTTTTTTPASATVNGAGAGSESVAPGGSVVHAATQVAEDRFVLYSQPIVHLLTNRVSHHELLLRIQRADGTVDTPGAFSDALRAHGLDVQLDRWVAECAVTMLWPETQRAGPQLEINISRHSAIGSELPLLLNELLAERRIGPDALIVEVAQGETVDPGEMRHFRNRGFRLACHFSAVESEEDAFAKLLNLHELPFDWVKIDGEFVSNLAANVSYQALVRRVAGITSGFGRRTVALHVEDELCAEFLRAARVDYGQGYYFGKPQPIGF